jgi:hypothetical protein
MATIREVKSWLKPLLQRHEDLAIVDRLLIVTPVRHHLRAVLVDRTSSADRIMPRWYVHHLFSPRLDPHISWGGTLPGARGFLWDTTNPDMQDVLLDKIETEALPILRRIETLNDFARVIMDKWQGHHLVNDDFAKVVIDLAFGNIELAMACCRNKVCDYPEPGPREADVTRRKILGAKQLCNLLQSGDVRPAVTQLHDWERQTVKNLKIEHLWQPTPFPIEEKLGLTA